MSYHPAMNRVPSFCLGLLAVTSLALPACDGGGEHGGGHDGAHGAGVHVEIGRIPPIPPEAPAVDPGKLRERAKKDLGALPSEFKSGANPLSEDKIALGRMLYYEGRLSLNDEMSCNSCHMLDSYGVDSLPTSPGVKGEFGDRNSPTVYNAAGHLAQFWDGREPDVEHQAKGPILNPIEMASPDDAAVVAELQAIPGYVEAFAKAFPPPEGEAPESAVSYDNLALAIGAFERRLVTPGPFDAFLAGDDAALSEDALHGLQLFLDTDCQSCHNGFAIGGASYQKLGTEKPWPGLKDEGRFAVTKDERDRFVFKVPSLRNIAKTGPYLHDGSIANLEEMVTKMVEHQTKRAGPFSEEELGHMIAFLESLTGELPADYIAKPELPPAAAPAEAGGEDAVPASTLAP